MKKRTVKRESSKGSLKRMVSLFTKVNIPWHLYVLQIILGLVATKVALLYVPYESELKLGNIEDISVVWGYIGLLLAHVLIGAIAAVPKFYASHTVTRNLQNGLLSRSLRLPMKEYEQNASQMISWITQDASYADGAIGVITGFIGSLGSLFMTFTTMAVIDTSMLWIGAVILGYIVFDTLAEGKLLFIRQRAEKRGKAELTAYLAEHLGQFCQIKQLHAEDEERLRGKQAVDRYYKTQVFTSTVTFLINLISGSLTGFINVIIFVVGVPLVRSGKIDLSALVSFQTYVLILYQSLSSLPSLYTNLMYYSGDLFYISKLMSSPQEAVRRKRSMDIPDEDIVFDHVRFSYTEGGAEDAAAIKSADFTIPKGQVTAIVGPNGSGKTTLFRLISRLYTPEQGEIRFGDIPVEDIHLNEWRQSMTHVLQDPQLFDGTIRENITYGMTRPVSDEEVRAAARLAYADKFIAEMPGGYDFVIGDNGAKLSAGQRQRIAIARAVMTDPAYLLLDEATCNMDVRSESEVEKALLSLMEGRTTVLITHDMSTLSMVDNIVVINRGVVEAAGPRAQVLQQSPTLQKLIAAEAGKEQA